MRKTEIKIVNLALARMDLAERDSNVMYLNLPAMTDIRLARGTFSRPVLVDPVLNHTELADRIATARQWERITGVKTPLQIEQIIQSWELDR